MALSISKIHLNVARDSVATRANEILLIKTVPPNMPRFTYDQVTLAPLGLLLETEAEILITQSDVTQWTRVRVIVTAFLSVFRDLVYLVKGNGAFLQHNIVLTYPTVDTPTPRTLSIL
jgi:hypothetical protein